MTIRRTFLFGSVAFLALAPSALADDRFEVMHTEQEWRRILGDDAYAVMREEATEPPGYSPLDADPCPMRLRPRSTTASARSAPNVIAAAVAAISATSSTTARSQPACAIASTAWR
jgi:hypothetical protein